MGRLLTQGNVTSDMDPGGDSETSFSCKGAKEIVVYAMPGHVNTTGFSVLVWWRPARGSDAGKAALPWPNSLDLFAQTIDISGADLEAQQIASAVQLIYTNPQAAEVYVQIKGITGANKSVHYAVMATD